MNIPLLDLKAQYQSLRSEILAAIKRPVMSRALSSRAPCGGIGRSRGRVCRQYACRGVASGSDALYLLALMALEG